MANDPIQPIAPPPMLEELARDVGGTIQECAVLPDGSGFATMSMPLPKDHWLTADGHDEPPMPLRVGKKQSLWIGQPDRLTPLNRTELAEQVRAAAKYAIRASTMNGKENDFDPDAMVQNFVVGLLGYWTDDGLSRL
jgi:hypothetical protein